MLCFGRRTNGTWHRQFGGAPDNITEIKTEEVGGGEKNLLRVVFLALLFR